VADLFFWQAFSGASAIDFLPVFFVDFALQDATVVSSFSLICECKIRIIQMGEFYDESIF
jgi:hypothetical protein